MRARAWCSFFSFFDANLWVFFFVRWYANKRWQRVYNVSDLCVVDVAERVSCNCSISILCEREEKKKAAASDKSHTTVQQHARREFGIDLDYNYVIAAHIIQYSLSFWLSVPNCDWVSNDVRRVWMRCKCQNNYTEAGCVLHRLSMQWTEMNGLHFERGSSFPLFGCLSHNYH